MVIDRFLKLLTSLRLTVALLCLGLVLVFLGTLAQVDLGLYKAQNDFFRSFFVYWTPKGGGWKIPVFPGGYLLGSVLLANLVAAHIKRFRLEWKKAGIFMIHAGLILLLLGQLLTDLLAVESSMHLRAGEIKNYSESDRLTELYVIDSTDPESDLVVAIPDSILAAGGTFARPELPFSIRVQKFYPNSAIAKTNETGFEKSSASQIPGEPLWWREEPKVTKMDLRDMPSAMIELTSPTGSLGTWLVSTFLNSQSFKLGNRTFQVGLRQRRHYKPFTFELKKFDHDVYTGTDKASNYSSLVHLHKADTGEDRDVRIYMNNPLRYRGETYYQASFDADGTILQDVRNPSWLTPYFSCALVGGGMVVQFLSHLFGFIKRRTKK